MNNQDTIIDSLVKLRKKSIVPDSNFSVACVIVDVFNRFHFGANIEFKDRTLGICAEGAAISSMIANFGYNIIKEVWIMGGDLITGCADSLVVPCGLCLQRLSELSNDSTIVKIISTNRKLQKKILLKKLLPYSFAFKNYMTLPSNKENNNLLAEILPTNNISRCIDILIKNSFSPDEKIKEAVILETVSGNFFYGSYFSTCCYKADIPALNAAIYNYLLSKETNMIKNVYYKTINSNFYLHPEFNKSLTNSQIIKVE